MLFQLLENFWESSKGIFFLFMLFIILNSKVIGLQLFKVTEIPMLSLNFLKVCTPPLCLKLCSNIFSATKSLHAFLKIDFYNAVGVDETFIRACHIKASHYT